MQLAPNFLVTLLSHPTIQTHLRRSPLLAPMCSKQLLALLRSERKLLKYTIAYDKLCMIR